MTASKYRWACHGCSKAGRLCAAKSAKSGGGKHAAECPVGWRAAVVMENSKGARMGVIDWTKGGAE